MSIKFRLTAMQFLQFFVWGAWLISLGGYMGGTLHFEGGQIGAIFATMGIASLIMPGLTGIIADKWINAERLYGILHLIGAGALIYASTATTYNHMYWAMLLNMLVYMPTLSLANTVSYNALEKYKMDLIKDFPPIRVWGTVGFICAMWAVDLTGFKASSAQLYVAAISAAMLGLYAFTLPACPPMRSEGKTMLSAFLCNHGYSLTDNARTDRYHRRQMDKRRTPLWHTPPHRCRCSDLCFNCHHIQPHVLGHAAQHACLHAYTISGQHRILQCIGKI